MKKTDEIAEVRYKNIYDHKASEEFWKEWEERFDRSGLRKQYKDCCVSWEEIRERYYN